MTFASPVSLRVMGDSTTHDLRPMTMFNAHAGSMEVGIVDVNVALTTFMQEAA